MDHKGANLNGYRWFDHISDTHYHRRLAGRVANRRHRAMVVVEFCSFLVVGDFVADSISAILALVP